MKGSFLADAPIVACSAVTGAGLDALKKELLAAAGRVVREDRSRRVPRLFLDRAFTMKGFGPVVTGTLDARPHRGGGRPHAPARGARRARAPRRGPRRGAPRGVRGRAHEPEPRGRRPRGPRGAGRRSSRRARSLPPRVLTAEVDRPARPRGALADGARVRVHLGTADVAGRLSRVLAGPAGASRTDRQALVRTLRQAVRSSRVKRRSRRSPSSRRSRRARATASSCAVRPRPRRWAAGASSTRGGPD